MPPPLSDIDGGDTTRVHRSAVAPGARWTLRLLVLVVAVLGPLAAFAGEREVTLDVEGAVRTVRTYAVDGIALLERTGIRPARDDAVTAGGLDDGDRVVFRRAKHVQLFIDGEPKLVVAHGLNVSEALESLGLVPGPQDHVHPPGEEALVPGMEIYVRNAIHTKVRADGRNRDVVSSADTVSKLLAHAGVEVGADDYVLPSKEAVPTDGMQIRVVRVQRIVEEKRVHLPFRSVTQNDPQMESGTRRVVQQGQEGLKVQRFSVRLEDGRRVSSRLLDESVVRPARDHIVRVGTRQPVFRGGSGTETGIASWFRTDGMVAAHRTLPFGTVVKVTNLENGNAVSVKINQRGPFIEGRVIDLSHEAFERLAPLGKGTVQVRLDY